LLVVFDLLQGNYISAFVALAAAVGFFPFHRLSENIYVLLASDRPFTAFSASIFLSNLNLANKFSQLKVASLSVTNRSLKLKIKNFFSSDLKISSMSKTI
jgi:hypothetical protein